jgi:hypothetical protein
MATEPTMAATPGPGGDRVLAVQATTVVVLACGARKATRPAPARALYTGTYHRAAQRAALAWVPASRVYVLSAKYGLLWLASPDLLEPYELRLGQPGAVTAEQVRAQAATFGILDRPVVALCGQVYTSFARQVWTQVTAPLIGVGGLGYQLRVLGELRAAGARRTGQDTSGGPA